MSRSSEDIDELTDSYSVTYISRLLYYNNKTNLLRVTNVETVSNV
jgi:hypothetical protein